MLFFLHEEYWKNVPGIIDPKLKVHEGRTSRHGICVTDFTLYNGKKAFITEDSAGNSSSVDGTGQRIITEDFFNERCYGAGYLIPKVTSPFTRTLKMWRRGNDVKELQRIIGCDDDGIFGPITKRYVIKFQLSHNLVGDGIVGPLTTKELNKVL